MQKISFSNNWNAKLFLDCFGTVRLHYPEKYFIGNLLEIELKGLTIGTVEVAAVRKFRFDQISGVLSYLDVGKPAHYLADVIRRMYENKKKITDDLLLDHVVLKYTDRNIDAHATLIKDWWNEKLNQQPQPVQKELFQ